MTPGEKHMHTQAIGILLILVGHFDFSVGLLIPTYDSRLVAPQCITAFSPVKQLGTALACCLSCFYLLASLLFVVFFYFCWFTWMVCVGRMQCLLSICSGISIGSKGVYGWWYDKYSVWYPARMGLCSIGPYNHQHQPILHVCQWTECPKLLQYAVHTVQFNPVHRHLRTNLSYYYSACSHNSCQLK